MAKGIESIQQFQRDRYVVYAPRAQIKCKYDRIQWIDPNTAERTSKI